MHYVYKIEIIGKIRYIGYTQDIKSREKQHNYLCFSKGKNKILYNNIKRNFPMVNQIKLIVLKTFSTKLEAKRFECYLILNDYFTKRELWQRIPRITDV